jgi:hypothetical protein
MKEDQRNDYTDCTPNLTDRTNSIPVHVSLQLLTMASRLLHLHLGTLRSPMF